MLSLPSGWRHALAFRPTTSGRTSGNGRRNLRHRIARRSNGATPDKAHFTAGNVPTRSRRSTRRRTAPFCSRSDSCCLNAPSSVSIANVDREITTIVGSQLVVPVMNASYVLNAAKAPGAACTMRSTPRARCQKPTAARGPAYKPVRGTRVIEFWGDFPECALPLAADRHHDATLRRRSCFVTTAAHRTPVRLPASVRGAHSPCSPPRRSHRLGSKRLKPELSRRLSRGAMEYAIEVLRRVEPRLCGHVGHREHSGREKELRAVHA